MNLLIFICLFNQILIIIVADHHFIDISNLTYYYKSDFDDTFIKFEMTGIYNVKIHCPDCIKIDGMKANCNPDTIIHITVEIKNNYTRYTVPYNLHCGANKNTATLETITVVSRDNLSNLSWTTSNSTIPKFVIYHMGTNNHYKVIETNQSSIEFDDANEKRYYQVCMATIDLGGVTGLYKCIIIDTHQFIMGPVLNVTAYSNDTFIELSWKKPRKRYDNPEGYRVIINSTDIVNQSMIIVTNRRNIEIISASWKIRIIEAINESVHIRILNLRPNNQYKIDISPISGNRRARHVVLSCNTTEGRSGPVSDIKANCNLPYLNISFSKPKSPNGIIIKYNITIKYNNGHDCTTERHNVAHKYINTTATAINVSQLPLCNEFKIEITPVNGWIYNEGLGTTAATTCQYRPDKIKMNGTFMSSRELVLSWRDDMAVCNNTVYIVKVHGEGQSWTYNVTSSTCYNRYQKPKTASGDISCIISGNYKKDEFYNVSIVAKRCNFLYGHSYLVFKMYKDSGPVTNIIVNLSPPYLNISFDPPKSSNEIAMNYNISIKPKHESNCGIYSNKSIEKTINTTTIQIHIPPEQLCDDFKIEVTPVNRWYQREGLARLAAKGYQYKQEVIKIDAEFKSATELVVSWRSVAALCRNTVYIVRVERANQSKTLNIPSSNCTDQSQKNIENNRDVCLIFVSWNYERHKLYNISVNLKRCNFIYNHSNSVSKMFEEPLQVTTTLTAVFTVILITMTLVFVFLLRKSYQSSSRNSEPKADNIQPSEQNSENNVLNIEIDVCTEDLLMDNDDKCPDIMPRLKIDVRKSDHRNKLTDFVRIYQDISSNIVIQDEYRSIVLGARYQEKEKGLTTKCGQLPVNEKKNRFKNIIPYDQSRVVIAGRKFPYNYINASFIPNNSNVTEYIASQGPINENISEFWTMIWQQEVYCIVMLTKTREEQSFKCLQYWPDIVEQSATFGKREEFMVTLTSENVEEGHCERILTVLEKNSNITRKITHLHMTTWFDQSTPNLNFFDRLLFRFHEITNEIGSPPYLIHCSAGVGRTGTFICIDRIVKQIVDGGQIINIHDTVLHLREFRMNMVQRATQYTFIYEYIRHFLQKYVRLCEEEEVAYFNED